MAKTTRRKAAPQKKVVSKRRSATRTGISSSSSAAAPTHLFDVTHPTTLLIWAGVALFFFMLVLILKSIS